MAQSKKQKQLAALQRRQADCKRYSQLLAETPKGDEHKRTREMRQAQLVRAQTEAKSLFTKLGLAAVPT